MGNPWMPLYPADFIADTMHLRAIETGAYFLLLLHYWQHSGVLPDDDIQLATITKMTAEEWACARPLLEPLFKNGKWKHKRLDAEMAVTAARVKAGRKGGKSRSKRQANGKRVPSKPVVVDVVVLGGERGAGEGEGKRRAPLRATGCRIPDDWLLSDEDRKSAMASLPENRIAIEFEKFRDYWRACDGKNAVKRDWSAAWRNWCRNANNFNGGGNGSHRQGGYGSGYGSGRGKSFAEHAVALARGESSSLFGSLVGLGDTGAGLVELEAVPWSEGDHPPNDGG
jgi:uncharacterized protein YdaU (DUF1376 family)